MNSYTQRYSEVDLLSVEGRIGRMLYFFYTSVVPFIFLFIFSTVAGIISKAGSSASMISYLLLGAAVVTIIFMVIRLTIQRCHDFNKPGWMAIFALIPLVNIIYALIPGTNGLNKYGEPPAPESTFIKTAVIITAFLLVFLTAFISIYYLKNTVL